MPKTKVIVIDDSRAARLRISDLLVAAGYEIVEAEDGHVGLARIAEHRDASLVICDLNMPKLGGLDVLKLSKVPGRPRRTPFLMLTTEAQPRMVQQAKQGGAQGWVVKPFEAERLLTAVRRLAG